MKGRLEFHTRNQGCLVPLITALYSIPEIVIADSIEKINREPGEPAVPGWFWINFLIMTDVPEERIDEIIAVIRNAADGFGLQMFLYENPANREWYNWEIRGDNTRAGELADQITRFRDNPVKRDTWSPPLRRDYAADAAFEKARREEAETAAAAQKKNSIGTLSLKDSHASVQPGRKTVNAAERKTPVPSPVKRGSGTAPARNDDVAGSHGEPPVSPPVRESAPSPSQQGDHAAAPGRETAAAAPENTVDFSLVKKRFGLSWETGTDPGISPDSIPPLFRTDQEKIPDERRKNVKLQDMANYVAAQVMFAHLFDIPVAMVTIEGKARFRFAESRFQILQHHRMHARILAASARELLRRFPLSRGETESDRALFFLLGLWIPSVQREAEASAVSVLRGPWCKIPIGNLRRELLKHGTLHRDEIEFILSHPYYMNIVFRSRMPAGNGQHR